MKSNKYYVFLRKIIKISNNKKSSDEIMFGNYNNLIFMQKNLNLLSNQLKKR
jgi:hypothetical protein